MGHVGLGPSIVVYGAAMSALANGKQWALALDLLREVRPVVTQHADFPCTPITHLGGRMKCLRGSHCPFIVYILHTVLHTLKRTCAAHQEEFSWVSHRVLVPKKRQFSAPAKCEPSPTAGKRAQDYI